MAIFNAMQFTNEEIKVFQEIFMTVDTDHSGSIEITELLDFLHIEESIFTERIFSAFDRDGTGKVDFFEFVVSLWKFCAMGKESICKLLVGFCSQQTHSSDLTTCSLRTAMFAFDLYDTDCDGALTETEVRVMFHDLYWYGSKAVEDEASRRFVVTTLPVLMPRSQISLPLCLLLMPIVALQDAGRASEHGRGHHHD